MFTYKYIFICDKFLCAHFSIPCSTLFFYRRGSLRQVSPSRHRFTFISVSRLLLNCFFLVFFFRPIVLELEDDSNQDGTCKLTFDDVRCDRTDNIELISIKEIKEDDDDDAVMSVKDEPISEPEYIETSSCPPSPCSAVDVDVDDTPRHYGKV